ncbi:Cyclin-dependent kinase inhibitor 3 [Microtus ochrogaster]|uniref:protein-tyrosine-phosphatase n=1 Tax=Microtus ochrogaster TaxID=79684 RepID=A0A8J6GNK1_MICOH|nr:Cyclin-dependent kinase inhibitor 3 [Microtus ochrogaster]
MLRERLHWLRRAAASHEAGCKFKDVRRNIHKDTEELKSYGIQDVFVFCTRGELSKYRVPNLLDLYQQSGIVTHHHPIPDGGTPDIGSCWGIMEELATCLKNHRKTLIQCVLLPWTAHEQYASHNASSLAMISLLLSGLES